MRLTLATRYFTCKLFDKLQNCNRLPLLACFAIIYFYHFATIYFICKLFPLPRRADRRTLVKSKRQLSILATLVVTSTLTWYTSWCLKYCLQHVPCILLVLAGNKRNDWPLVEHSFWGQLSLEQYNGIVGALVVDGQTLKFALSCDLKKDFLQLYLLYRAVICCRVTPIQEA